MKMNRHGKSSTLLLVMLILLAGAMLVGGTFAEQFTLDDKGPQDRENDTSAMDYAVTLSYFDADAAVPGYVDMFTSTGSVTDGLFWCPGRTEVIYLKVKSEEQFPVQAIVSVKAANVDGMAKFGNTLSYKVFDGIEQTDTLPVSSWAEVTDETPLTVGENAIELFRKELLPATSTGEHYVALAIHMDENADSQYRNAQMNLDFSLRVNANNEPGPRND